jgi:hypothetical protein
LWPVWAGALVLAFGKSPLRNPSAAAANFLLALTGTVLGVDLFFRGFQMLQRRRLIEDTPRSKIRGAAIGQVEVYGKVVGPYTIISPLTVTECFMYVTSLYSLKNGFAGVSKVLATETLAVPFFIEDETGRILVDPRGAELQVESTPQDLSESEPESIRRLIARHAGPNSTAAKATERCIKPGDMLFVLGNVRENPRTADPQSAAALQFDELFLSPEAAALQRRRALADIQMLLPKRDQPRVPVWGEFDLNPVKVLGKARGGPFLISWRSQRDIVRELAWRSVIFIWGGPVMTCLSLAYLGYRLSWW